jgi:hypothetical protein
MLRYIVTIAGQNSYGFATQVDSLSCAILG